MDKPSIFVVMGVSGCGKSTLGTALAEALGAPFFEGDEYHPPANIEKMSKGIELQDVDRQPWLAALRKIIVKHLSLRKSIVLSCSALKRSYRDTLGREPAIIYIYLDLHQDILNSRISARSDHFMPRSLVASQLQTLELPQADEQTITLKASETTPNLITEILMQTEQLMCGAN